MLNREILTQLLTDPELREQVPRLLRGKFRADASTFEANAFVSRQVIEILRNTKNGTVAANTLRGIIKDYLDFCETLVNMQLTFNGNLMERLRTLPDVASAPDPSKVTMDLEGAPSGVVRKSFKIENNRSNSISVGFESTSFVNEGGTHIVNVPVVFDPPSLELKPGQEARIELIVEIGGEFMPDAVYLATVTIRGLDAPHLLVRLHVAGGPNGTAVPAGPEGTDVVAKTPTTADQQVPAANPKRRRARNSARSKKKVP